MDAYMLNNYYVFTDYNELSAHIYDVLHYSLSNFSFSIEKGHVYWDKMVFINDDGKTTPLMYESEDNLYYSVLSS